MERDFGVAIGFPDISLKRKEIIVTRDILDVLKLDVGDEVEITVRLDG